MHLRPLVRTPLHLPVVSEFVDDPIIGERRKLDLFLSPPNTLRSRIQTPRVEVLAPIFSLLFFFFLETA